MVAVKAGDRIAIHYLARSSAGELVATSAGETALQMVAGGDEVIRGLSMGVIGMQLGEERVLRLAPEEGFGADTGSVERFVASNRLPEEVEIGDLLRISMAGMSVEVWVVASEPGGFRVRTQHALAGESLHLEIELVSLDPQ